MHFNEAGVTDKSIHFFSSPSARVKRIYLHTLSIGHFFVISPYRVHRMRFDSFLLLLIVKGSLLLHTSDGEERMLPGVMMLIDCYQEHYYYADDSCEFYFFHFDGPESRPLAEQIIRDNKNGCIHSPLLNQYLPVFTSLLEAEEKNVLLQDAAVSKEIYSLLCDLSQLRVINEVSAGGSGDVANAVQYIQEHIAEPLTIDVVAKISGYSTGHLNRLFHLYSGMSIYHYIMLCRIDQAKMLLHTTKDSIHLIGQLSGFESDAHFVRTFKKYTGYTPLKFRRIGL